ncbi:MND1-interacting protein 1-like [Rutidosis leptorrhynchoides]|uniref:MND1-interacting protein 1-like n=1 Tax=Rutidosis leptorrhynchoides TaxID=125765 RepID=UPI003A9A0C0A
MNTDSNGGVAASGLIGNLENSKIEFTDLRDLLEYWLTGMVHLFHGGWGFGNDGNSEFLVNDGLSYSSDLQRDNYSLEVAKQEKKSWKKLIAFEKERIKLLEEIADEKQKSKELQRSIACVQQRGKESEKVKQIGFGCEEWKEEIIAILERQIKDLQKEVKERKDWTRKKALHAVKKFTGDSAELDTLWMERNHQFVITENDKNLDKSTMKRLVDIERDLNTSFAEAVQAEKISTQLEKEKGEIRAELEAANLNARVWDSVSLELVKAEKKAMALEKLTTKLQEEISNLKEKTKELEYSLACAREAEKEAVLKWREAVAATKEVKFEPQDERRAKKKSELDKKLQIHCLKAEIDLKFRCYRDDIRRLEEESSRLLAAPGLADNKLHKKLSESSSSSSETMKIRACMICMNEEATVLFLPCAHMALCFNCNEIYGMGKKKKGGAPCPRCRVPIEERIHTFY